MPWLTIGPVTEVLQDWINTASAQTSSQLYLAKNTILGANQSRLVLMRTFYDTGDSNYRRCWPSIVVYGIEVKS